jgi:hypothetical protein
MGFSNIINKTSQIFFIFFYSFGWVGPEVTSKEKPILDIVSHNFLDTRYGCDNFDHFNYGILCYVYSLSKKLRESRKDNMSKENVKELLNTITTKDAVTAVKIAMQLNEDRNPTIDGLINLAALLDKNSKLLATKVLELEKKIESLESYANREI